MRKLRLREVKCVVKGHRASKQQSWDANSGSLAPEPVFAPALLYMFQGPGRVVVLSGVCA